MRVGAALAVQVLATMHCMVVAAGDGATLYCFAVATPGTPEPQMLAAQFMLKVGIFGCDAFDVISNVSAATLFAGQEEAAVGLTNYTHVLDTNLTSSMVNGHLANTPIFQKVWKKVFALKRFMDYDWTMKLDIDAVLVPNRLKDKLSDRPHLAISWNPYFKDQVLPFKAEYMLNSDKDLNKNMLHGPVELLSKGAMQLFEAGADRCEKDINSTAYGPLALGEDYYLNRCLSFLGVPSVPKNETNLLYDKYEYGGKWKHHSCGALKVPCCPVDGYQYWNPKAVNYAVYHYHKNITSWIQCYTEATNESNATSLDEASIEHALNASYGSSFLDTTNGSITLESYLKTINAASRNSPAIVPPTFIGYSWVSAVSVFFGLGAFSLVAMRGSRQRVLQFSVTRRDYGRLIIKDKETNDAGLTMADDVNA